MATLAPRFVERSSATGRVRTLCSFYAAREQRLGYAILAPTALQRSNTGKTGEIWPPHPRSMTANVPLQPARADREIYRPVSPPISLARPNQTSQRAPRRRTPRSLWGTLDRSSVPDFASLQSPALAQ